MQRYRLNRAVIPFIAGLLLLPAGAALGRAEKTLNKCQKTAAKETRTYVQQYFKAVSSCANGVSEAVLETGQPIATAAPNCQKAFLKLVNTSKPGTTLAARLAAKIEKACVPPPDGKAEHSEADVLGTSGSGEDIQALNLDTWCANFGGGGTVDSLDDWVACLTAAGTCTARQKLAATYPRLLEWLNAVRPGIAALDPACGGSCSGTCSDPRVIDACAALDAVELAIDGATDDDLPEISCAPEPGVVTAASLLTNQTTCYDAIGGPIPCAGTGQDGEIQAGVARSYAFDEYSPVERTVIDFRTGLEWEVLCDEDPEGVAATCPTDHDVDTVYTWSEAFAKIAGMNTAKYGGHSDWRLPNFKELQTLVKYDETAPAIEPAFFHSNCVAPCAASHCSCTAGDLYWSSTSGSALFQPERAGVVHFTDGQMIFRPKTNTGPARAVRSRN